MDVPRIFRPGPLLFTEQTAGGASPFRLPQRKSKAQESLLPESLVEEVNHSRKQDSELLSSPVKLPVSNADIPLATKKEEGPFKLPTRQQFLWSEERKPAREPSRGFNLFKSDTDASKPEPAPVALPPEAPLPIQEVQQDAFISPPLEDATPQPEPPAVVVVPEPVVAPAVKYTEENLHSTQPAANKPEPLQVKTVPIVPARKTTFQVPNLQGMKLGAKVPSFSFQKKQSSPAPPAVVAPTQPIVKENPPSKETDLSDKTPVPRPEVQLKKFTSLGSLLSSGPAFKVQKVESKPFTSAPKDSVDSLIKEVENRNREYSKKLEHCSQRREELENYYLNRRQEFTQQLEDMNETLEEAKDNLKELSVRLYMLNNECLTMNTPKLRDQMRMLSHKLRELGIREDLPTAYPPSSTTTATTMEVEKVDASAV